MAGALAPPAFVLVLVPLTLASRGFLADVGWSPVERRDAMWPSILALGPHGWVMAVMFPACGIAALAFAAALPPLMPTRTARAAAALIALVGVALALLAFETDAGPDAGATWHGVIHDVAYPPIPALAVAFALTAAAPIAQAARFALFGGMLVWFQALALTALRRDRGAGAPAGG